MPDDIVSDSINHYEQQYYHSYYLSMRQKLVTRFSSRNHFIQ
jgi:hypothetical protein